MIVSRITSFGYAAVVDGKEHVIKPPRILKELPVRLMAGIGAVYFFISLMLLQAGGVQKEHILPILGILAAFITFVYRTTKIVASFRYRRRLKAHAKRGTVVFVPLQLFNHAVGMSKEQGSEISPALFDADLQKTAALVETFEREGFSLEVKKALNEVI